MHAPFICFCSPIAQEVYFWSITVACSYIPCGVGRKWLTNVTICFVLFQVRSKQCGQATVCLISTSKQGLWRLKKRVDKQLFFLSSVVMIDKKMAVILGKPLSQNHSLTPKYPIIKITTKTPEFIFSHLIPSFFLPQKHSFMNPSLLQ